jgi:arginine utilization protein RocB
MISISKENILEKRNLHLRCLKKILTTFLQEPCKEEIRERIKNTKYHQSHKDYIYACKIRIKYIERKNKFAWINYDNSKLIYYVALVFFNNSGLARPRL